MEKKNVFDSGHPSYYEQRGTPYFSTLLKIYIENPNINFFKIEKKSVFDFGLPS